MKILCVSMLRLGDLLLVAPAIRGLRTAYPDAEIHLLTNRSNQGIAQYLKDVDKVYYFERDRIQDSLSNTEKSVFEAEDRILDLMKRLQRQGFQKIINFSHTKISGLLLGLCDSPEKIGLQVGSNGKYFVESNWYRFLNSLAADPNQHHFHYSDFFKLSIGLSTLMPGQVTDLFRAAVDFGKSDLTSVSGQIAINPWSSDTKKDLSPEFWIQLLQQVKIETGLADFVLIAGPDRHAEALRMKSRAADVGLEFRIVSAEFPELLQFLKRQRMLITVDSVVKHLAAFANIKIIEIALGGSVPAKTGAYASGALVISSAVQCAPCDNFRPCHKSSHECGQSCDPKLIASVVVQYGQGEWLNIRNIAEDVVDEMRIYRTSISKGGIWHLIPLRGNEQQNSVVVQDHLMNLAAWKIVLEKSHLDPLYSFNDELENFESEEVPFNRSQVSYLEGNNRVNEMALDTAISLLVQKIKTGHINSSDYRRSLEKIETQMGLTRFLTQHLDRFGADGLGALRGVQDSLNQLRQFQIAKSSLHKSLKAKEL